MSDRHADTGTYPDSWADLSGDGSYPGASFRAADWPRERTLNYMDHDKPSVALRYHKYVIEHASGTDYLIRAIDRHERATWQIRAAVTRPEKLAPAYCHDEDHVLRDREQEAVLFLKRARWKIRVHVSWNGFLPKNWSDFYMHFSLDEHLEDDPAATPSPGTGARWRPPGARYSYVLENSDCALRIVSENDLGLPNYVVEGAELPPRRLDASG